jgi:hypothetical protein
MVEEAHDVETGMGLKPPKIRVICVKLSTCVKFALSL